jgi:hypothetical protein
VGAGGIGVDLKVAFDLFNYDEALAIILMMLVLVLAVEHPHHFCDARDLLQLFSGFEPLSLVDREHDSPGSWHWHILAERQ